jgi:hypothetical protein
MRRAYYQLALELAQCIGGLLDRSGAYFDHSDPILLLRASLVGHPFVLRGSSIPAFGIPWVRLFPHYLDVFLTLQYRWLTIPGTAIASFIFTGYVPSNG